MRVSVCSNQTVNSMDFIFTEGLRGRSLTKPALDEDDDAVDSAMDSVKTPRLPELPNVLHTDLSRSVTHLGVRKFVIDTPRDQELKKREQLWQFHKKNRGAMAAGSVPVMGLRPVKFSWSVMMQKSPTR